MSIVTVLAILIPMPVVSRLYAQSEPSTVVAPQSSEIEDMQGKIQTLSLWLADDSNATKPATELQNARCDQTCENGSEAHRADCMAECAKLQAIICSEGWTCKKGCRNHLKDVPKDKPCESLCDSVSNDICYLGYEAPKGAVSPHHDEQVPPSIEATPAPRIHSGSVVFCNLYPAQYEFEVMALESTKDKEGPMLTKITYKQCDKIDLKTGQFIGLKAKGVLAAISKPITKIPSVMLFGQSAFGNHQVEFNRYYAQSDGPMLCNGFPVWYTKQVGQQIEFQRDGKKITTLKYKDCYPTSLKDGEVVSAWVKGAKMGEYRVIGSPSAVVLGKAGQTTAIAFEAWTDNEV